MQTRKVQSKSAEETEQLGEQIGARLRGGEVIELVSDLGGGKTALTRGLARGLGSKDHVASPTFTISREYHADNLTLHHFDFYRLSEPGIMSAELAEIVDDPLAVVVVEWSDIVRHVLPERRLTIRFVHTGDSSRDIELSYPSELEYVIPEEL